MSFVDERKEKLIRDLASVDVSETENPDIAELVKTARKLQNTHSVGLHSIGLVAPGYAIKDIDEGNITSLFSGVIKNDNDAGYFSVKEVAERFDVSIQTVYKWIKEGKIKFEESSSPGKSVNKGYKIPIEQFIGEDEDDESKYLEIDPTFRDRIDEDRKELYEMSPKDLSNWERPTESSEKMTKEEFRNRMKNVRKQ